MKIYIVLRQEIEETTIYAVCISEAKAEEICRKNVNEELFIEEYDVTE